MHPRGNRYRTHAVRHHNHIRDGNAELFADVPDEGLNIADHHAQILRRATVAGRLTVAASVPGENRDVRQIERLNRFLPAPRVLVAAVEKQECLVGGLRGSQAR